MGTAISVRDVSFAYDAAPENTLENVSFDISYGEFVLLCGMSGVVMYSLYAESKMMTAPEMFTVCTNLFEATRATATTRSPSCSRATM